MSTSKDEPPLPLDSIDSIAKLTSKFDGFFNLLDPSGPYRLGELYCPKCGDRRRMAIHPIYTVAFRAENKYQSTTYTDITRLVPCLLVYRCVQCEAYFTVVGYPGPTGPELVVLPSELGGLRTPHTPEGVAFYLDQAGRAHSIGAHSAAVAMFRGALEQLMFEQGFKTGMLGNKLADLVGQIQTKTAPKWAYELDDELLGILKQLGDGSIHPNDGDISKQAEFDKGFLVKLTTAFTLLLFLVYEVPHRKKDLMDPLRTKATIVKK